MAFWSFKHTWQWFDHISSTIYHKFMILEFLEMGEKYIQLSCWTKFHLKPLWWCKIKLNLDQNLSIFGNFQLQVTFHFGKLLPWLQILQDRGLKWQMNLIWNMNEMKKNQFPSSKPTVDFLLTFWLTDDLEVLWSAWASTTWGIGSKMKP
jgi:hypothetical protein